VIAHVGGAPVEELLLPLMTVGTGIMFLISRARSRVRPNRPMRGESRSRE
jgi:hypothetical protein